MREKRNQRIPTGGGWDFLFRREGITAAAAPPCFVPPYSATGVLPLGCRVADAGARGIAAASGQAALHLAIATLMDAGSHIVSSAAIYGGSHNLKQ